MNITVNNESHHLNEGLTLAGVLQELNINTDNVAAAVNMTVVPKEQWEYFNIREGDNITLIRAVQGG